MPFRKTPQRLSSIKQSKIPLVPYFQVPFSNKVSKFNTKSQRYNIPERQMKCQNVPDISKEATQHIGVYNHNNYKSANTNVVTSTAADNAFRSGTKKLQNTPITSKPKPNEKKEKASSLCETPPSTIKSMQGDKRFKRGPFIGAVSILIVLNDLIV